VNLIVPSTRSDCAASAIIMEPTEYPPMSGSNTMCIATVLLETGIVPMQEPLTKFALDNAGGTVEITAMCRAGKCESVSIQNVPAVALKLNERRTCCVPPSFSRSSGCYGRLPRRRSD
jgi:proline racemase